jgi:hypothetical protein
LKIFSKGGARSTRDLLKTAASELINLQYN